MTEIFHLLDPLGNGNDNFTMDNIAGCGGVNGTQSATHPPGVCEDSSAIRVGDYKLIVGQVRTLKRSMNRRSHVVIVIPTRTPTPLVLSPNVCAAGGCLWAAMIINNERMRNRKRMSSTKERIAPRRYT